MTGSEGRLGMVIELSKERARKDDEAHAKDVAELAEVRRLISEEGMSWAEAELRVTGIDATKYGPRMASDPPWAAELREQWRERRSRLRLVK
jgi:hypothetical protein